MANEEQETEKLTAKQALIIALGQHELCPPATLADLIEAVAIEATTKAFEGAANDALRRHAEAGRELTELCRAHLREQGFHVS